MKFFEPKKPESIPFSSFFGSFYILLAHFREYLKVYNPVQLRWDQRVDVNDKYKALNIGQSKGLTFERILLYPTNDMQAWMCNHDENLEDQTRAKFYVATTRAKHSVGIVCDEFENIKMDGKNIYT